jgi:hypothetical protein
MKRLMVLVVVAVAVSAAGVLGAIAPASACTYQEATPEELLARADVVFEGVALLSRDPSAGAPGISSGDPIIWTFAVDRQVKGSALPQQEVGTPRGGATCGVDFAAGVRYRVYAVDQNGVFMTFLGSGTVEAPAPPPPSTTPVVRSPRPLSRTG